MYKKNKVFRKNAKKYFDKKEKTISEKTKKVFLENKKTIFKMLCMDECQF